MTFNLNSKKAVSVGLIVAAVALIVAYFIFAKNAADNYVPVWNLFGIKIDKHNVVIGKEALNQIRLILAAFGLGGFGAGFLGSSIKL